MDKQYPLKIHSNGIGLCEELMQLVVAVEKKDHQVILVGFDFG
jgi:hypothetical protein